MTPENSPIGDVSSEPSIVLIRKLNSGDSAALGELYLKYHAILAQRISRKLWGRLSPLREDVVISTFRSFQRRFRDRQFPHLEDCDDLLGLLTCIAVRKAINTFNREVKAPQESPVVDLAETRELGPDGGGREPRLDRDVCRPIVAGIARVRDASFGGPQQPRDRRNPHRRRPSLRRADRGAEDFADQGGMAGVGNEHLGRRGQVALSP